MGLVMVQFFSRAVTDSPFLKWFCCWLTKKEISYSCYLPTKASYWNRTVLPALLCIWDCILAVTHYIMPHWCSVSLRAQNLCVVWVKMGTWIHNAYMFSYWILGMGIFQDLLLEHNMWHREADRQKERGVSVIILLCSLTGMLKSLYQTKEKSFEQSCIRLLICVDRHLFGFSVIYLHG